MLNRLCFALLAISFAAPSYAAKPISLPMPVAQELQVEMIESQQEIGVVVPATATAVGMQFGLIGALIGSAVQNAQVKNAEEKIIPLRNAMVDYRFNQKMEAALRAKLASDGISPSPVLTVMPTTWEAHDAQQSARLPPHAMVLTPGYVMDSDFSQLTVSLRVSVVDRTVKSNGKIKAVPRFGRLYSFQYPLQGVRSEDEVQDWIKFESAGLARLLDQGIEQVTDMLVYDFSAEGRAMWESKPKKESAVVNGTVYAGLPVRQGEGWAWVRNGKGWAQSMQGFQPLTVGVQPALRPTQVAAAPVAAAVETTAVPATTVEVSAVQTNAGGATTPATPAAEATPASAPATETAPAAPDNTPTDG